MSSRGVVFDHPVTGWTVEAFDDWYIRILLRHGWQATDPLRVVPYFARLMGVTFAQMAATVRKAIKATDDFNSAMDRIVDVVMGDTDA
jgi:hypothetical protein